jgi:hypothetical protein
VTLLGVAGLAAPALALAVPVTAHANGTPGGTCPGGQQHTGPGHHSFTHSDGNCVTFSDPSQTAFLNTSDFNSIVFETNTPNNTVRDFSNSNNNAIDFMSGASGNTLSSSGSNGNSLFFCGSSRGPFGCPGPALNDVVLLDHVTNEFIGITGSGGDIRIVDNPNDPNELNGFCAITITGGTPQNPIVVTC